MLGPAGYLVTAAVGDTSQLAGLSWLPSPHLQERFVVINMLLGTKGAALFPEQSQGMKWEQGKGEERGKTDDGNTKVKERERKE